MKKVSRQETKEKKESTTQAHPHNIDPVVSWLLLVGTNNNILLLVVDWLSLPATTIEDYLHIFFLGGKESAVVRSLPERRL